LDFYGVRRTFFKSITSYLNNRYQRGVIKDKQFTQYFSDWKVRLGVPQGSILRPFFVVVYINDVPAIINDVSKSALFAEYISIILTTANHRQLKENFAIFLVK
jgi:hypothetical protein